VKTHDHSILFFVFSLSNSLYYIPIHSLFVSIHTDTATSDNRIGEEPHASKDEPSSSPSSCVILLLLQLLIMRRPVLWRVVVSYYHEDDDLHPWYYCP
jgi:hypothetical protein